MMQKISRSVKKFVLIIVSVVIIGTGFSSWFYLSNQKENKDRMESITIGNAQSFECDTLVYIAKDQNYFPANNLRVTIKNYTSGAAAVNDLLKGQVDIAATAEFPLVRNAFKGENISAMACIGRFQLQDIICRKDHGIENISDLIGKRIGVSLGTISEFYLGRFLDLHRISLFNVTIVNIDPSKSVEAMTNGSLDALIIWQPYAYTLEALLGDNAVVWPAQSNQQVYIVEVANDSWIANHSDVVDRFLLSLAQAEDYYLAHPLIVKAMMEKNLNYTDSYMTAVWDKNEFSLSLDESLVLAMRDEARWMINNNLTKSITIPDVMNYIYIDGLQKIKPGAVNIIR